VYPYFCLKTSNSPSAHIRSMNRKPSSMGIAGLKPRHDVELRWTVARGASMLESEVERAMLSRQIGGSPGRRWRGRRGGGSGRAITAHNYPSKPTMGTTGAGSTGSPAPSPFIKRCSRSIEIVPRTLAPATDSTSSSQDL
jgi:hypothetical protein